MRTQSMGREALIPCNRLCSHMLQCQVAFFFTMSVSSIFQSFLLYWCKDVKSHITVMFWEISWRTAQVAAFKVGIGWSDSGWFTSSFCRISGGVLLLSHLASSQHFTPFKHPCLKQSQASKWTLSVTQC